MSSDTSDDSEIFSDSSSSSSNGEISDYQPPGQQTDRKKKNRTNSWIVFSSEDDVESESGEPVELKLMPTIPTNRTRRPVNKNKTYSGLSSSSSSDDNESTQKVTLTARKGRGGPPGKVASATRNSDVHPHIVLCDILSNFAVKFFLQLTRQDSTEELCLVFI